jgi:3-oxoacyl-[acyl-carrier-protein] synthase III
MLNGTITLDAVESFFPDRTVTVEERAAELGLNPAQTHMFRRIHGLDRLHYDADVSLHDLLLPPARKILSRIDPGSVRYLLYGYALHTIPPFAADTAQEVRDLLGLRHATAFALTQQNCAIPLSAIDIAGTLLRADGDPQARALVVTGDKPLHRESQVIMNTSVIGDGAASCLVSWNGPGAAVRSFVTRTRGEFSDGMWMTPQQFRAAAAARPVTLREVMEEAARQAGYCLDDIGVIIPTNPNVTFWAETIENMRFGDGKVFLGNIPRYAHCLASDTLINYVTLRDEHRFAPGQPAMFVAVGIGMTFSAMVLTPVPVPAGAR